jgi:phosphosulfolactate phosphohydrolase-like enzyme
LDDYLAAGSITSEILKLKPDAEMDEELFGAHLAYEGTVRLGLSIGEMILTKMKVRKDLERVGETEDAYIASEVNKYSVVPVLRQGHVEDALKEK